MDCGSLQATFPPGPVDLFQGVQTQRLLKSPTDDEQDCCGVA